MVHDLRIGRTAARQIDRILAEIERESSQGATSVRDRLLTTLSLIENHPYAGRATSRPGVRRIPVIPYPYHLFYRVSERVITVLRVRHSARQAV